MMPRILDELLATPPEVFVIQTRGPLILRDLSRLVELSRKTTLRVSFSITTNREEVRKLYEPHCATIEERLHTIRELRQAPASRRMRRLRRCCRAIRRSWPHGAGGDGRGHHRRSVARSRGEAARRNHARSCACDQPDAWPCGVARSGVSERGGRAHRSTVRRAGRRFATGPEGFGWLANSCTFCFGTARHRAG